MYRTNSKRNASKSSGVTSRSTSRTTKKRNRSARATGADSSRLRLRLGSQNLFEDLGFDPLEAANLKIRADLMIDLRRFIEERGWNQAQAAKFFAETQPRISNLLKGEIGRFSVDKLINMLAKAGMTVQVETKRRAA